MGIISNYVFNGYEIEESEEMITKQMSSHKDEVEQKFKQIEITENIDKKIELHKDIIQLDNTKEKNILEYLKFLKDVSNSDERYKSLFLSELEKLYVCISEENYNKYFSKELQRKNATKKIQDFIEMIKDANDLDNLEDITAKSKFLDKFDKLLEGEKKFDLKINKKLTKIKNYICILYIFF